MMSDAEYAEIRRQVPKGDWAAWDRAVTGLDLERLNMRQTAEAMWPYVCAVSGWPALRITAPRTLADVQNLFTTPQPSHHVAESVPA